METTIVGQKCLLIDPETKKIFVMYRSDYKQDGGVRDFVGGRVDYGENLVDAIKREALEESGIILDVVRPLDIHSRLIQENVFFVFNLWVSDAWHFAEDEIVLSHEHTEYRWVDITTFLQLPKKGSVLHVQPVIEQYMHQY